MPFTYPLGSLMARTGLRVMTVCGATSDELAVSDPLAMPNASDGLADGSALTFADRIEVVQADVAWIASCPILRPAPQ